MALVAGSGLLLLATGNRGDRAFTTVSGRRRSLSVVEEIFRRLPRISLRLVLLDEQRLLRADGVVVSGRHSAFRARAAWCGFGEQCALHFFCRTDRPRLCAVA